ncbi:MAG: hypothetical protein ABIQ51_05640 [Mesorhizobium sp.]
MISIEDDHGASLRAAEMLRDVGSTSFDAATENALVAIASELKLGRQDLIRFALGEWLEMRDKRGVPDE